MRFFFACVVFAVGTTAIYYLVSQQAEFNRKYPKNDTLRKQFKRKNNIK